jgi:hypothetical protein
MGRKQRARLETDTESQNYDTESQNADLCRFHRGLLACVIAAQQFLDEGDETFELRISLLHFEADGCRGMSP